MDSGHPSGHFAPSEDWQEVPGDAVLPAGLQIRVDIDDWTQGSAEAAGMSAGPHVLLLHAERAHERQGQPPT